MTHRDIPHYPQHVHNGPAVSPREPPDIHDGPAVPRRPPADVQNVGPVLFCFLGITGTIDENGENCEQAGSPLGSGRGLGSTATAPCATPCPTVLTLQPSAIYPNPVRHVAQVTAGDGT